jgi:branched-chain amino acid transport system permease protein
MSILPQIIINSIIAASVYALLALGFTLIYRTAKFFDIGYGALTAVGGYMTFLFARMLNMPIWLSVIIGVAIAGFVGFAIDKLVYVHLRKRKATNMILLVASLGVFTALQAIVAIFFTSQFRTLAVKSQPVFKIAGGSVTLIQVITIGAAILVTLGLVLMLKKTMFGKAIKAIGDDVEVSKIVGINTRRVIGYVFFIGSAIAGLAGILVGFDTGIEPIMGLSLLLKGIIAAIIGGVGNIWGALLGAVLLGFVENFGIWQISGEWKDAIAFVLLIIFLLVRPQGIFGNKN